jgi:hypothetical protein
MDCIVSIMTVCILLRGSNQNRSQFAGFLPFSSSSPYFYFLSTFHLLCSLLCARVTDKHFISEASSWNLLVRPEKTPTENRNCFLQKTFKTADPPCLVSAVSSLHKVHEGSSCPSVSYLISESRNNKRISIKFRSGVYTNTVERICLIFNG